jgi:CDP-diacylglycerol--glycerol-3-phosphate 3-phosphatidyltransferase
MGGFGSLTGSIVKTLAVLFLLQCLAFWIFFRLWLFPPVFLAAFVVIQPLFHAVVLCFLLRNRRLFYNTASGKAENSVNGANTITLFRITMLPLLILLTLVSQKHGGRPGGSGAGLALTAAFALTFASDFVDGRLARRRNQVTYIGRILDSACDYLLLGVSAGAFFYFDLLTGWLFALILIRLFLNAAVMLILFVIHRKLSPQTTPLGKIAIAAIMALLVLEAARTLPLPHWTGYAEPAAALVIGISLIDKLVFLVRGIRGGAGA